MQLSPFITNPCTCQYIMHLYDWMLRYVGDENPIVNILATMGPVAVAVDASTWNNYIGGIIQFHCESNINHAVQIVGYDYTGQCLTHSLPGVLAIFNSFHRRYQCVYAINNFGYLKLFSQIHVVVIVFVCQEYSQPKTPA